MFGLTVVVSVRFVVRLGVLRDLDDAAPAGNYRLSFAVAGVLCVEHSITIRDFGDD